MMGHNINFEKEQQDSGPHKQLLERYPSGSDTTENGGQPVE